MNKVIYYGASRDILPHEKRPTLKQAMTHGQTRYWGTKEIEPQLKYEKNMNKLLKTTKKITEKVEVNAEDRKKINKFVEKIKSDKKLKLEGNINSLLEKTKKITDKVESNAKERKKINEKIKDIEFVEKIESKKKKIEEEKKKEYDRLQSMINQYKDEKKVEPKKIKKVLTDIEKLNIKYKDKHDEEMKRLKAIKNKQEFKISVKSKAGSEKKEKEFEVPIEKLKETKVNVKKSKAEGGTTLKITEKSKSGTKKEIKEEEFEVPIEKVKETKVNVKKTKVNDETKKLLNFIKTVKKKELLEVEFQEESLKDLKEKLNQNLTDNEKKRQNNMINKSNTLLNVSKKNVEFLKNLSKYLKNKNIDFEYDIREFSDKTRNEIIEILKKKIKIN